MCENKENIIYCPSVTKRFLALVLLFYLYYSIFPLMFLKLYFRAELNRIHDPDPKSI